jgi:hypothetical protein
MNFRSSPHPITWKRTVIGGQTLHGDFVAEAEGQLIGRVMKIEDGPQRGTWSWSFLIGHSEFRLGDFNGVEADKQKAADRIKAAFAHYLEFPVEKGGGLGLPPNRWAPGSNAYAKAKGG